MSTLPLRFGLAVAAAAAMLVSACAMNHAAPSLNAADVGDPARGLAYARANCAQCHAVEADANWSPTVGARSFEAIANTPGMTDRALRVWLNSSHQQMPHIIVDPADIDDLAAYLASLEG